MADCGRTVSTADHRAWALALIPKIMAPGNSISKAERAWLIHERDRLGEKATRGPSEWTRDKLRRLARRVGLMPPPKTSKAEQVRRALSRPRVDWQHRPGSPVPTPPPLRRGDMVP